MYSEFMMHGQKSIKLGLGLFLFFEFPTENLYAFVCSHLNMWREPPITSSYTRLSRRPVTVLFGPPSCYLSLLGPDMVPRALWNSLTISSLYQCMLLLE